jgi:hypothetical protein
LNQHRHGRFEPLVTVLGRAFCGHFVLRSSGESQGTESTSSLSHAGLAGQCKTETPGRVHWFFPGPLRPPGSEAPYVSR